MAQRDLTAYAMVEYWCLMAVNPRENSDILQDRQESIRVKAAHFVGAWPDEIALTRNTTEAQEGPILRSSTRRPDN